MTTNDDADLDHLTREHLRIEQIHLAAPEPPPILELARRAARVVAEARATRVARRWQSAAHGDTLLRMRRHAVEMARKWKGWPAEKTYLDEVVAIDAVLDGLQDRRIDAILIGLRGRGDLQSSAGSPPPRRSEHRVVHVRSGSGRDLTGDGTRQRPFRTIEQAFAAAPHLVGPHVEWVVDARRDDPSPGAIIDRILCGLGVRRAQAVVQSFRRRRST